MQDLIDLLPTLLTIIFCIIALLIVSGSRFNYKITLGITIPFTIIVIILNAFVFIPRGTSSFEQAFIFTVFIPFAILLLFIGKKRGIALATGLVNAYLGFYLMFLIKAIFAPRFQNQIGLQFVIYFLCFPLILLYLKFFYKRLQDVVEELVPEYLSLLLLYGITMFFEFWIYQYIINGLGPGSLSLRLEIFGVAIFSVYIISITGFYIFIRSYKKKMIEISDNRLLETQFKYFTDQQQISADKEAKLRVLRHDMKHLLLLISGSIKNGEEQKALKVIDDYIKTIDNLTEIRYCKDNVINSIINFYVKKCSTLNIKINVKVTNFEDAIGNISSFELGILLSNIFDNAINATSKLSENREIEFVFVNNLDRVILKVKNTYDKEKEAHKAPVIGEQLHGFGSKSVKLFAKRNDCFLDYDITDTTYQVTMLFKENQN